MSIELISQWVLNINQMKICKNCTTINTPEATTCIKCSMKGMLIDAPSESKKEPALKVIYHSCKNCGTSDAGKGSKCNKCHFPLPKVQSTDYSQNSKSKIS